MGHRRSLPHYGTQGGFLLLWGWWTPLSRWRRKWNRHTTDPFEKGRTQNDAFHYRQSRTLAFLSILRQLDKTDSHCKLLEIQRTGRWLISYRPYILEHFDGKFGSGKKLNGFSSANGSFASSIGHTKQGFVIRLHQGRDKVISSVS